jgi:hypothetical protein
MYCENAGSDRRPSLFLAKKAPIAAKSLMFVGSFVTEMEAFVKAVPNESLGAFPSLAGAFESCPKCPPFNPLQL